MKKLLIIKTGETLNKIINRVGDFEDLIINKTDLNSKEIMIYQPYKGESFPDIKNIKGIIITGSHTMVTDDLSWVANLSEKLKINLSKYNIPVLGICFGHQLLADMYGGKVDYHPIKKEIGCKEIFLNKAGRDNILFKGFKSKFTSFLIHEQSVLKLPPGAKRLAYNDFVNNQAFYLKENIWGVQFHPEFTIEVMEEYILDEKDKLIKDGFKPDKLIQDLYNDKSGEKLIRNFLEISNK